MFVKAQSNEYLVVAGPRGVSSRGIAGSAFLWPGWSYALVTATKQEACFEMTQETRDGIPLRFKGTVVYRVADPVLAMRQFDFTPDGQGHQTIKDLINHLCLGHLRAVVSHMTMSECIEQRETTLTDRVANALHKVIARRDSDPAEGGGWGIELDVVQVAQVFIVDDELRRQLEAEVRDKIKATSELSQIRTQEQIQLAKANSDRVLQLQETETERVRHEVAMERLRLQQAQETETEQARHELDMEKLQMQRALEQEQIEAGAAKQLLQSTKQHEVLEQERTTRRLATEVKAFEVEEQMILRRAEQALRMEILPVEQVSEIAAALSHMFQGANLSIYGPDSELTATVLSAVTLLTDHMRHAVVPNGGESK